MHIPAVPFLRRLAPLSALALLLASCEDPRQRQATESAAETSPPPAASVPDAPADAPPSPAKPRPSAPAAAEPEPEPAEPELYVAIENGRLIVRGALTSRIQQERILETLEQEFPDLIIEKDLKLEYHRHPVAWGNRVADPFLVRYLKEVSSPKVTYREGIVTLEGKPKGGTDVKMLSEMAIETFAGDRTRDLVNHLVKP